MRIGLIDVDSKLPNLALMKLSAWHKAQGDSVEWYNPFDLYDRVYMAKVFNFTPNFDYAIANAAEIIRGGTGYDIHSQLPAEVDRTQPDYDLYPNYDPRHSLGFLTRGCPNKCPWCVVPKKEGAIRPYMDIDEITQDGKRPYATLMDNNILAIPYGLEQIDKIIRKGYHVDFNQALDARLVTDDIAAQLARVKWIGSLIRFGCDTPKQISECERVIEMMTAHGFRGQWLLYCMIHGDIHECVHRLEYWKTTRFKNRIRVMAQPYRDPFPNAHLAPPMATPHGEMGKPKGVLHNVPIRRLPIHQRWAYRLRLSASRRNGRGTWRLGPTSDRRGGVVALRTSRRAKTSNAMNT